MKRVILAGATLGSVVALTGCNAVRPGAAATVGSARITVDDLGNRVDAVYTGTLAQQMSRAQVQRSVLNELIQSRLDDSIAASEGVSIGGSAVQASISQTEADNKLSADALEQQLLSGQQGAAVGYAGLTDYVQDFLTQEAIRKKLVTQEKPTLAGLQQLYAADIGTYQNADIAVIVTKDKAGAQSVYSKVKAAPDTFAAVAKAQSIDTSTSTTGGDEGVKPRGTFTPAIESAVYAAKAGDILTPIALANGAFAVVKVVSITNTPFEQALPALLQAAADPSGTVAQAALKLAESQAASKLGVWINPRFGTWGGAAALTAQPSPDLLSQPGASSSSDAAADADNDVAAPLANTDPAAGTTGTPGAP